MGPVFTNQTFDKQAPVGHSPGGPGGPSNPIIPIIPGGPGGPGGPALQSRKLNEPLPLLPDIFPCVLLTALAFTGEKRPLLVLGNNLSHDGSCLPLIPLHLRHVIILELYII